MLHVYGAGKTENCSGEHCLSNKVQAVYAAPTKEYIASTSTPGWKLDAKVGLLMLRQYYRTAPLTSRLGLDNQHLGRPAAHMLSPKSAAFVHHPGASLYPLLSCHLSTPCTLAQCCCSPRRLCLRIHFPILSSRESGLPLWMQT